MYLGLDTVQQASPRAMLQRLVRRSRADQTGPPWGIVVLPTFQELKLSPPGPIPQGACVERLAVSIGQLLGNPEVCICDGADNGWQGLICRAEAHKSLLMRLTKAAQAFREAFMTST